MGQEDVVWFPIWGGGLLLECWRRQLTDGLSFETSLALVKLCKVRMVYLDNLYKDPN